MDNGLPVPVEDWRCDHGAVLFGVAQGLVDLPGVAFEIAPGKAHQLGRPGRPGGGNQQRQIGVDGIPVGRRATKQQLPGMRRFRNLVDRLFRHWGVRLGSDDEVRLKKRNQSGAQDFVQRRIQHGHRVTGLNGSQVGNQRLGIVEREEETREPCAETATGRRNS